MDFCRLLVWLFLNNLQFYILKLEGRINQR